MKSRLLFPALVGLILCSMPAARAVTINWGTTLGATILDSNNVPIPTDGTFTFALGAFDAGPPAFEPSEMNTESWEANWTELEAIPYTGVINGAYDLNDNTQVAPGQAAYFWIYNSKTPGPTTQWAFVEGVTADPNQPPSIDNWVYPTAPGTQQDPSPRWFVADLQTFLVPEPSSLLLSTLGFLFLFRRQRS